MPGQRATLRPNPDYALNILEREGQANMQSLRQLVTQICGLGDCRVGDPNKTRAIAINGVSETGQMTPQFFAIITDNHRGLARKDDVGLLGFSCNVAFRDLPDPHLGSDWETDQFDLVKSNGVRWWRYAPRDMSSATLAMLLGITRRARGTF